MGISYNSTIVTDGLVLCLDAANPRSYPGSGNTWLDLSLNNRNANISGLSYDLSNSGIFNAVEQGDRATVTYNSQNFANTSWTWEIFWSGRIHPDVTVHNMPQLGYGSGSWQRMGIFRYANGNCAWVSYSSSGSSSQFSFNISPSNTGWIQNVISADYSGSVVRAYYNGSYYSQKSGFPSISGNDSLFGIGRAGTTYFLWNESLQGNIGLVRVYNRALSAQEIRQNFNATRGRYGI